MLGPTAAGKTEVAVMVAERLGGEVISVDSMQVYRGMDIGTAKPTLLQRRGIPHHLIDVAEPEEVFSVAEFRRVGRQVLLESTTPVMVITGGSGLHFRALVDPMRFAPTDPRLRSDLEQRETGALVAELLEVDPDAGSHVDVGNPRRVIRAVEILELTGETPSMRAGSAVADEVRRYVPEVEFRAVGVDPGGLLEDRIERRLHLMREGGLTEEVRRLANRMGRTAGNAVGYREIAASLRGETSLDEAYALAAVSSKKLARRQRTWFQRDPRIRWIPWVDDVGERAKRVLEVFE